MMSMSHPPLNRIHSKALWQQFKELANFVNIQTHAFVVARGEVNFLG